MIRANRQRSVGRALVDQLAIHGVRHAFCVPGESYLEVLDALHDSDIAMTVCRQEGGAAMMAEAVGKATGRPGICFVTRGPGATNASAGLHIAQHDGTPLIMFAGQVDKAVQGRGAWQELDYRDAFDGMCKWVTELDDPDRVAEVVARAFRVAMAGRPGPVVIGLPRDVLLALSDSPDAEAFEAVETGPGAEDMARFEALLRAAERPVVILGGSRWSEAGRAAMLEFATRFDLPIVTSYRRAPLFDADHPGYAGDLGLGANPKLIARIKASDLVVLLGGRLGEVPSQGYTLLDVPVPQTTLVHVYPEAEELGRIYTPSLAVHATPDRFARALAGLAPPEAGRWSAQARAAHADYLAWSETPTEVPGAVNFGAVMVWLRERLGPDAILCNGAGNYASWLHRFYRFRRMHTHIAPTSASMGYGVPAAVAMKRLNPERQVISINGDGDFLMNGQEFATAVQYDLPVIVLVIDNGSYGSIRMSQERAYPGRVYATDLKNPDFAAYARAFGGFGATVERTEDFAEAFEAAAASGLPAIIHVKTDVEALTPTSTIAGVRAAAAQTS